MSTRRWETVLAGATLSTWLSCGGTAGGELFELDAIVVGVAREEGRYTFQNDRGFTVELEEARLHVGAVYLNESVPTSVASDTSCALAGIYVAEVFGGVDVDVLSGEPVRLPGPGAATTDRARTAELWLTSGDLYAESDPTEVAFVRGIARRGEESYPFRGRITIGQNRVIPPPDPAQPGARPICKQRIVTPIAVDVRPEEGGTLVLHVDPAGWFGNVDFSQLTPAGEPSIFEFRDDDGDAPSRSLYAGVRANAGPYRFEWRSGFDE